RLQETDRGVNIPHEEVSVFKSSSHRFPLWRCSMVHRPTFVLRQGGPSASSMEQRRNPALACSTLVRRSFVKSELHDGAPDNRESLRPANYRLKVPLLKGPPTCSCQQMESQNHKSSIQWNDQTSRAATTPSAKQSCSRTRQ